MSARLFKEHLELEGIAQCDDLARIEATLIEIGEKLDRLLAPRLRSEEQRTIQPDEVIERYKLLGTMGAVAHEFGVSTQRIQQIIAKHEKVVGISVPRRKYVAKQKPRIVWTCQGCGSIRKVTVKAAACLGSECGKCRRNKRRRFTDAQMDAFVTDLKTQGRGKWSRLARTLGYSTAASHLATNMVFAFLLSNSRTEDIGALWPRGVPHWLMMRHRTKLGVNSQ